MPGADASQYTAFKKHAAAAKKPTSERNSQAVTHVTSAGDMVKFLPSLTIKNTSAKPHIPVRVGVPTNKRPIPVLDVYVSGQFRYTAGTYTPGGDYSALIAAIAAQYGVDVSQVNIKVSRGSIIVEYQINGVPSSNPPPSNIATAISAIIKNDTTGATKLVFNNNDARCNFTLTNARTGASIGLIKLNGKTVSGTIDENGVGLNYTAGISEVQVPSGYSTMTVILAGSGAAGTPSSARPSDDRTYIGSVGAEGRPGGLLVFKVPITAIGASTFTVNIGRGGRGYFYGGSNGIGAIDSNYYGTQGEPSSINFRDDTIAVAQGGPQTASDSNDPQGISGASYPNNSAYLPIELVSSGYASNGAAQGPTSISKELAIPGARFANNGGDGYCTLLFDNTITTITSPPKSLKTTSNTYYYTAAGTYTIPVPTYYRTMKVTMWGAGGGAGGIKYRNAAAGGAVGGSGQKLEFTIPTGAVGGSIIIKVGEGGNGAGEKIGNTKFGDPSRGPNYQTAYDGEDTSITSSHGFFIAAGGGTGGKSMNNDSKERQILINGVPRSNSIYVNTTNIKARYNRIEDLVISTTNNGGIPTIWNFSGLGGNCTVMFDDLIPFSPALPKIVITGNWQSISAKYYDQNDNDITSTITQSGTLWLYSDDPIFGKQLSSVTSTNNYISDSKFSLNNPPIVTYFMYDRYYGVRSNYLPVNIPPPIDSRVYNVKFIGTRIMSDQAWTIDYSTNQFYAFAGRNVTLTIDIYPIDVYGKLTILSGNVPVTITSSYQYGPDRFDPSLDKKGTIGPQVFFPRDKINYTANIGDVQESRWFQSFTIKININGTDVIKTIIADNRFRDGAPGPVILTPTVPPTDPNLPINVTGIEFFT